MAQSALSVTPPNPSPPTNFPSTGTTGPNPPNYSKTNYANPFNMDANGWPQSPYGVNPAPAPYYDDGAALTGVQFAANVAALAGGTGATSGGTENTYPGTGTGPNGVGAVPAPSSVAHEGAGTEVVVTQTYPATVLVPGSAATYAPTGGPAWTQGDPGGPLRTVSAGQASFSGVTNSPNASHASSLTPLTNPAISATPATALSPSTIAAGAGTFALTVTGTGFTKQSVVYINGIPQTTVFVSSTSLTVAAALKKATAGTFPVTVVTGGAVVTANAPVMTYT